MWAPCTVLVLALVSRAWTELRIISLSFWRVTLCCNVTWNRIRVVPCFCWGSQPQGQRTLRQRYGRHSERRSLLTPTVHSASLNYIWVKLLDILTCTMYTKLALVTTHGSRSHKRSGLAMLIQCTECGVKRISLTVWRQRVWMWKPFVCQLQICTSKFIFSAESLNSIYKI